VYRKILPLSEAQKVWKKQLKFIANLIKISSQFDLKKQAVKKINTVKWGNSAQFLS
jgi:hypothetical protein